MTSKRVAVLRGGPSTEYEVSMVTGQGVLSALNELGYYTKNVTIDRQGEWLVDGFVKTPEQVLADIDVVFLALHGSFGEDGVVQRLLDRFKIPYTGSGPYASKIALNKYLTKEHLKDSGILMPKHLKLVRDQVSDVTNTVQSIRQLFGPKYVVKPLAGGSSIDTVLVENSGQLGSAVQTIIDKYPEILVEECITGKEATVGVLENFRDCQYYVLPEIEIVPPAKARFFSADVKYTGETEEIVPGRFSKEEKRALAAASKLIHKTLGLTQYSRSDFIVTPDGIYFLEVNTLPGLTSESLFPKSMQAVGSTYNELIDHLVTTAVV